MTRVLATWSSRQTGGASLLAADAHVRITRAGTSKPVYNHSHAPADGSYRFTARQGATYTISVSDRDVSGHRSSTVTRSLVVPYDDTSFTVRGDWSRVSSHGDIGGSHIVTTQRSALARATVTGRSYSVAARTGPSYGKLAVLRGSTRVKVINLFAARPGRILVRFFGGPHTPVKRRTFTFRATGTRSGQSSGTAADVDALEVSR
jgi:hypothetical protein